MAFYFWPFYSMLYFLEPTQRQEDCQSPWNMRWDTQLFTRLARCDRKEERCSCYLEVEGEPCATKEAAIWQMFLRLCPLFLILPVKPDSPSWVVHVVAFPTLEKRWLQKLCSHFPYFVRKCNNDNSAAYTYTFITAQMLISSSLPDISSQPELLISKTDCNE